MSGALISPSSGHLPPSDNLLELVGLMPSPSTASRWRTYIQLHLRTFAEMLRKLPLAPGSGSLSTAEAFWLFRLVTELQPHTIIDSGSATGWSAFILAAAAPAAQIHCFDPYRRPALLPSSAEFHGRDWTRCHLGLRAGAFGLFDDHVNQRRRVIEARRAGLTDVVFHDVYRVLTKSTVSLTFVDLIGLVEQSHTFEPLWSIDPIFTDTSVNPQMYRWLTWLRLAPRRDRDLWARLRSSAQRRLARNPGADERSRLNWKARL